MNRRSLLIGALVIGIAALRGGATENRFWLVSQYDWGKNTGVYLTLEGRAAEGPCTLAGVQLAFMVGDGSRFYYTYHHGPWEPERVYSIKSLSE